MRLLKAVAGWFAGLSINRLGADGFVSIQDIGNSLRGLTSRFRSTDDALGANVVMAPVQWMMRTFTQAEPVVQFRQDGQWIDQDMHPAAQLLENPNDAYGGDELFGGVVLSYMLQGNSYILKVRDEIGAVRQLWYLPHWTVRPRWPSDGSAFISHYDYLPLVGGGRPREIARRDMVHLRFGLDPRNVRLGLSPLGSVLREVVTDEEASDFTHFILKNMGIPGGIISPASGEPKPSAQSVETIKEHMDKEFTGENRGKWLVMGAPTKVTSLGVDPHRMMVGPLRDISEERVCAITGIPAAVVGFGSGLQQTKVGATMRELVRLAWVNAVTPAHKGIAGQLSRQLLPDFVTALARYRFDNSGVSMFSADETDRATRAVKLFDAGLISRDEGREMTGHAPEGVDGGEGGGETAPGPNRLRPGLPANNGGVR